MLPSRGLCIVAPVTKFDPMWGEEPRDGEKEAVKAACYIQMPKKQAVNCCFHIVHFCCCHSGLYQQTSPSPGCCALSPPSSVLLTAVLGCKTEYLPTLSLSNATTEKRRKDGNSLCPCALSCSTPHVATYRMLCLRVPIHLQARWRLGLLHQTASTPCGLIQDWA